MAARDADRAPDRPDTVPPAQKIAASPDGEGHRGRKRRRTPEEAAFDRAQIVETRLSAFAGQS